MPPIQVGAIAVANYHRKRIFGKRGIAEYWEGHCFSIIHRGMAMLFRKLLCWLLVWGILQTFVPIELLAGESQQQGQTLAEMKTVVQKAWSDNKAVNVLMKDKQKLSGHVTNVADDDFSVASAAAGAPVRLAFTGVQKVKQKGMHPAVKAVIVIGIVIGSILGISYAAYCGSSKSHC